MSGESAETRVCIVATSDAMVSPASGLFETLKAADSLTPPDEREAGGGRSFAVEIVAERAGGSRGRAACR